MMPVQVQVQVVLKY